MKRNLKTFPKLGNDTMSHAELCGILEKVADWKVEFKKELRHILSELDKTDDSDGNYNPFNITYPYSQFWRKKINAILGEATKQ